MALDTIRGIEVSRTVRFSLRFFRLSAAAAKTKTKKRNVKICKALLLRTTRCMWACDCSKLFAQRFIEEAEKRSVGFCVECACHSSKMKNNKFSKMRTNSFGAFCAFDGVVQNGGGRARGTLQKLFAAVNWANAAGVWSTSM